MRDYAIFGLLGLFLYAVVKILRVGRRPANYPPGPPTIPILGNIHQMPSHDLHVHLQKWAKQYGPIYSVILGTQPLIVLSSAETVKELMDRRSNIASSKPDLFISADLISGGYRILFMKYDQTWRMTRKLCHSLLNVQAAKRYVPYQVLENKQMLSDLLDTPDDFVNHMRRYSNSLTVSLIYGRRVQSQKDPDMLQLFDGAEKFEVATQQSSSALLDAYPILRKLPGFMLPMVNYAKQLHKVELKLYLGHYLRVKRGIQDGTAKACFCVEMAKLQKEEGFSDEQAAYIAGSLLEAGSDTTASTMVAWIQAMAVFPDVLKKAQAEMDRVIGPDRLPTMEDEYDLPYIRAMMKESLRWMPTAITGAVPHVTTQDQEYNGYFIPKGSQLLNNVWAIHHDETRYPNPREFRPERYEGDTNNAAESAASPNASNRDHFGFGVGRRICQGMHIAERSLFLGISRMVWGFNITPKMKDGKPVPIDTETLTQGFVCMPEPFECEITPRDAHREKLIRKDWENARNAYIDPETYQIKEGVTLDQMSYR